MFPHREIKIQSFRKQSSNKGHIMNEFQKFLCVVNRHKETNFLEFWIFWLRSFFGPFLDVMDQKMTGAKKSQ